MLSYCIRTLLYSLSLFLLPLLPLCIGSLPVNAIALLLLVIGAAFALWALDNL